MKTLVVALVCTVGGLLGANAAQPVVAIHDSELTRALESMPASGATPTGTETTSNQWWTTQWHYFVMPDSAKEALRSDGTAFAVVSDVNIRSGGLLDSNGLPAYPIVVSFASEAVSDDEIAPLTNYVAAGGYLLVGSSAFTRNTNGTTRGDFAFANQLGVHMANTNLLNWMNNYTFSKTISHRITSHIPGGTLTWQMPSSADEVSWPYEGVTAPERIWQVQPGDATVIAQGDASPYLLVKPFGKGYFIYDAAMQPLIGHGGYAPGMYAYGIFRKAIEWSFQSAKLPVAKLSPWPYPYDAAFMVRHDLENFQDEISNVSASAQFENANGAKGDYYFCTGTLRQEMTNSPAVIAGLRQAVSNYNATIGPHNGGLPNPQNPSLAISAYDYWHWGPDQAFDVAATNLPLPGYPNGQAYALTSLSNSFLDVEGWLSGFTNGVRSWVAPYFNATREASYQIEDQLGVRITGEDKIGPFPHWTLSTQTPDKRYPLLQLPVSDWYILSQVAQGMESGHADGTIHDLVDYYYNLGALINLYSHSLSTGGTFVQDYITYALNTNLHPRIWSANSLSIYSWWLQRSNAQITASYATNGNRSVTTITITGASDPQTAVEILVPSSSISGLQVLTNGIAASGGSYRTNGSVIKLLVGSSVTNAQISYILNPSAQNYNYTVGAGQTLTVPATGVLGNDTTGAGTNLTAMLLSGPAHGILSLSTNGGFSYTPTNNFTGVDSFTYLANDGVTNSSPAIVTIDVPPTGSLFFDDFARSTNADPLAPWTVGVGRWTITNGVLQGTASGDDDYSDLYAGTNWGDYSVEAQIQMPANVGAWDSGLSGRVNPLTGERYLANIYPEGSAQAGTNGSPLLRLLKFHGWRIWNYTGMAVASLPGVGTNWHALKLTFRGNRIRVYYDGTQYIDVTDNGFDGVPAYTNGAVSAHMFMAAPFIATFDNLIVSPLPVTPTAANDSYSVIENRTLTVPVPGVLANDTLGLGTNLTAVLVNGSTNGTLSLSTNGGFTYTPNNNFFGTDGFTYLANDGQTNSDPATVTITVLTNRPPVANGDSYSLVSGRTLTVSAPGILSNDTVGWGTNLTAVLVSGTAHGTFSLNTNGGFTYTATNHFIGTDSFTYEANDGVTNSVPATVTINVTTNYPPVANNDSYNTITNATLSVAAPGVLGNDTDANGDSLTSVLVSGPAHGILTLTNNGGFSYTPANNFSGTDGFTYQASDGLTNSSPATVTISITTTAVNHSPVANNDTYSTVVNTALTVGAPGILANDTDLDGDSLTAILVSGPTNGTLNLNTNGGFSYTPTNNFVGTDSFIYKASDGSTNSNPATVTITVTTNQPAGNMFFDDFTRATNAGSLAPWVVAFGVWTVTNGVMEGTASNQSDYADAYVGTNWGDYIVQSQIQIPADGWGAGISGRLNPANGASYTAVLYPQGGSPLASGSAIIQLIKFEGWKNWSYNPMAQVNLSGLDANWHVLKLAFRGDRIAVYFDGNQVAAVTDNNFDGVPAYTNGGIGLHMFMSSAFVATYDNVTVTPLVTDDSYGINENTSLLVGAPGVLGNDTAVYGSNLVAVLVSGPTNGILNLNTNGGFTYTPALNYVGTDSFTYHANDGQTSLGIATVTITVSPGTFIVRPTILSLTGAGTANVVIRWSAVSNVTYRVQHLSNLSGSNWLDLAPDVTATNTTASAVDNPNGATPRFYRVKIVP